MGLLRLTGVPRALDVELLEVSKHIVDLARLTDAARAGAGTDRLKEALLR